MWPLLIGTLGALGIAGMAYAAGGSAQSDPHPDESRAPGADARADRTGAQNASDVQPHLESAAASYWHAFNLQDTARLKEEERTRRATGRTQHIEALARIIESEAGAANRDTQRIVAWLARNRSLATLRPLHDLAAPGGQWGPIDSRRPFSSSQPATKSARVLACAVLDAA
jgi:hypothetical protein